MSLFVVMAARSIFSFMKRLFKMDKVTGMASVELWVLMTTFLLVSRFVLDFFGPWNADRSMVATIQIIEMLNYAMVQYTMGLMQLSAAKVNDYFQVWAVLLVTLQYSVKIGRPYSRSKQLPILDLMSSLWAANLIRLQTLLLLKIPLWIIWSLNSLRIISYFFSSDKASDFNQENTRLVSDYMRYEHTLDVPVVNGNEEMEMMQQYRYLVIGEDEALKQAQEEGRRAGTATPAQYRIRLDPGHDKLVTLDKIWRVVATSSSSSSSSQNGVLGCSGNRDVCLSFALYKLLRRRFYDLPLHEAGQEKTAQLVFDYILQDGTAGYERAFRVAALELSFLQDLFYSKHAAMFAGGGFPAKTLLLSLSLVAATGYVAYPVRRIPDRMDQADRNTITHGVFITRLIVALIVCKELSEIYLYVFSQWTKVLILCKHVRSLCLRHPLVETVTSKPVRSLSLRHRLVEMVTRMVFWFINRGEWNQNIGQYNLLISPVWPRFVFEIWWLSRFRFRFWGRFGFRICGLRFRFRVWGPMFMFRGHTIRYFWGKTSSTTKPEPVVKKALLDSFKLLKGCPIHLRPRRLESYFHNAFGSDEDRVQELKWAVDDLETDTHRILVWHIATCICEINLSGRNMAPKVSLLQVRPLVDRSEAPEAVWPHYATASTLSNYCAYLVTKGLVPDNGLVNGMVFREVRWETMRACFSRRSSLYDVHEELRKKGEEMVKKQKQLVEKQKQRVEQEEDPPATHGGSSTTISEHQGEEDDEIDEAQDGNGDPVPIEGGGHQENNNSQEEAGNGDDAMENSIVLMGAKLAVQLMNSYETDRERMWRELAEFWTGFLLHLAASTRAAKHRTHLVCRGELITILWALLSHAGFLGRTSHGHTLLDPEDLDAADPLS